MPCFEKEVQDFPQALIKMMMKDPLEEPPLIVTFMLLKKSSFTYYFMRASTQKAYIN